MRLIGCEIEVSRQEDREELLTTLQRQEEPRYLVLDTCQRLEVYGPSVPTLKGLMVSSTWEESVAFERLARIAAGMESRILGELEVLGQVRSAYKAFKQLPSIDSHSLDQIFQDVLSLARKARRMSSIDSNITSWSALASREILSRIEPGEPLAVVGSGSMAGSVARYFSKRGQSPVRVTSRCPENAITLAMSIGGFGAGLDDLCHVLKDAGGVVTATTAPHPVVYPHHLEEARRPLVVVDLGDPPDCCQEVAAMDGVEYISMRQIEIKAHINTEARRERALKAGDIIREGAMAWARSRS